MAQVIAAFTDFLVGSQDAVHGADRAMVDALVEQDGVDLSGGLVGKTRRAQKVEYGSTFHDSQRAPWARPGSKRGQRPGQTGTPNRARPPPGSARRPARPFVVSPPLDAAQAFARRLLLPV